MKPMLFSFFYFIYFLFCYQFAINRFNKGNNSHIELTLMVTNIYLSLSSFLKFHIPKISAVSYSSTNQFLGKLNN